MSDKCPKCEAEMERRRNLASGEFFLGCSRYPACRGTRLLPERIRTDRDGPQPKLTIKRIPLTKRGLIEYRKQWRPHAG